MGFLILWLLFVWSYLRVGFVALIGGAADTMWARGADNYDRTRSCSRRQSDD